MNILMKLNSFLIVALLFFASCEKKESAEKAGTDPGVNPGSGNQPAVSNSSTTTLNQNIGNLDWIGQFNGQLYAADVALGTHLLRFNGSDRKLTLLKKISSAERFQAIAHSMDEQGNIYFYAMTDGANVGVMKMDADGKVAWKKKLKVNISVYNYAADMRPAAIKLINGYLWALSSHFLFKIDPSNGNVLKTSGIGSTADRWMPGQDIIRAGENIMIQMGGGQLHFYIMKTSDLSLVKTVTTAFTHSPTSGYPTNTIIDVADNRFFALTHYREQSSLFPRGIIIEFDSDGKIINNAIMRDGANQFEVTRMHRDSDGNYAVAYNTLLEITSNLRTKDVLIFNRNLELIHKTSLVPTIAGSAISYKGSTAALFNPNTSGRVIVEWIDMKNAGCKVNSMPSMIKLENIEFKVPVVNATPDPIFTQIKFSETADMTYTVTDVSYTQTEQKCIK